MEPEAAVELIAGMSTVQEIVSAIAEAAKQHGIFITLTLSIDGRDEKDPVDIEES